MGYYTTITGYASISLTEEEIECLNIHLNHNNIDWADISGNYIDLGNFKAYDFVDDMTEISKEFPDIVFQFECHGEEFGDVWKAYFKNGKNYITKPKISWDDFDITKLR